MPAHADTILLGGTVVTMDAQFTVHHNGAVALSGDTILAVGPAAEVAAAYTAAETVSCDGQVIMPGLVNAHTHIPMTLFRGLHDDLRLDVWLGYLMPLEREFVTPAFVRLGARLAQLTPGDLDVMFFTTGGADANENAIKLARQFTGRAKILVRYRSYHGATGQAMVATGDPRRWSNEMGGTAFVRVPDAHRYGRRDTEPVERSLEDLEEVIMFEGPHTIAAFLLEPVVGANGILIPPDGYMQGVRKICDKYGILLIADEVMSGFGRTGKWFAVEHWGVVPDMITMAKGLTSSYVPLGAVALRRPIADTFDDEPFFGGLTYHSHPVGCAAALAVIDVYEQDGLIERSARLGEVMRQHHEYLYDKHPSVGAHRNIGLFGILELVLDRESYTPLAPYNGTSPEMQAMQTYMRERGLFILTRWNTIHTNPPLIISEEEMAHAFEIIDDALYLADEAYRG